MVQLWAENDKAAGRTSCFFVRMTGHGRRLPSAFMWLVRDGSHGLWTLLNASVRGTEVFCMKKAREGSAPWGFLSARLRVPAWAPSSAFAVPAHRSFISVIAGHCFSGGRVESMAVSVPGLLRYRSFRWQALVLQACPGTSSASGVFSEGPANVARFFLSAKGAAHRRVVFAAFNRKRRPFLQKAALGIGGYAAYFLFSSASCGNMGV